MKWSLQIYAIRNFLSGKKNTKEDILIKSDKTIETGSARITLRSYNVDDIRHLVADSGTGCWRGRRWNGDLLRRDFAHFPATGIGCVLCIGTHRWRGTRCWRSRFRSTSDLRVHRTGCCLGTGIGSWLRGRAAKRPDGGNGSPGARMVGSSSRCCGSRCTGIRRFGSFLRLRWATRGCRVCTSCTDSGCWSCFVGSR